MVITTAASRLVTRTTEIWRSSVIPGASQWKGGWWLGVEIGSVGQNVVGWLESAC